MPGSGSPEQMAWEDIDDDDKHEPKDHTWTSVDEQNDMKKRLVESGCRGECNTRPGVAQAQAGKEEPPAMMSSDGKEPPLFDESSQYWEDSDKNNVHGTLSLSALHQMSLLEML
jgi:hypothetical protein